METLYNSIIIVEVHCLERDAYKFLFFDDYAAKMKKYAILGLVHLSFREYGGPTAS